ncbi:hypothetical protein FRC02_003463 [Tulasnella sp. 418]|nr:hypothetical protein FRC02_003463 [Tulasnella sp. 418]
MTTQYDQYPPRSTALLCRQFLLEPGVIEIGDLPCVHASRNTDEPIFWFLEYLVQSVPRVTWGVAIPTVEVHLCHLMETYIAVDMLRNHYDLANLQHIFLRYVPDEAWEQQMMTWQQAMDDALAGLGVREEFYSIYDVLDEEEDKDEKENCAPYATQVPRV